MSLVFSKAEEEKRRKIIEYIKERLAENPKKSVLTIREISKTVGETPNTVTKIIEKIEEIQSLPFKPVVVKQYVKIIK